MLILILIDVQCLQKVVFSFEKGFLSGKNPSSGSPNKISDSPHPLTLFGKPAPIQKVPKKFSPPPTGYEKIFTPMKKIFVVEGWECIPWKVRIQINTKFPIPPTP